MRRTAIVITAVSLLPLVLGWKLFWFLTDDAFIAFRYVSNSHLGFGYVWNAPPFLPVEGYTSFGWVVLLDAVWRCFGVEPPDSANYLSLAFSAGTVFLSVLMALRLQWTPSLGPYRVLFAALSVCWLLVNRTFLAWTSSGLETAMFNFYVHFWFFSCGFLRARPAWRLSCVCSACCLIYLTRPDGLLFALATLVIGLEALLRRRVGLTSAALAASPLLVIPVHLLWRRWFYHAWLPNTYYAKIGHAWPESGVRYLLSFVLEYALWFGLAVIFWGCLRTVVGIVRPQGARPEKLESDKSRDEESEPRVAVWLSIASLTVIAHIGYYTVIVGGDHFEYRVYSYLLPLIFLCFLWAMNKVCATLPVSSLLLAAAFVLLSIPVPWTHWAMTHTLNTREQTVLMRVPVSPAWPAGTRWYAKVFDDLQFWLIEHYVCVRHQEHKVYWTRQVAHYPTRLLGSRVTAEGFPVKSVAGVGVASWVLPHVNIIDVLGLNDYVIARTPTSGMRKMAHEHRWAPVGYLESYPANVEIPGSAPWVVVETRKNELTAAEIAKSESQWRKRADEGLENAPLASVER